MAGETAFSTEKDLQRLDAFILNLYEGDLFNNFKRMSSVDLELI